MHVEEFKNHEILAALKGAVGKRWIVLDFDADTGTHYGVRRIPLMKLARLLTPRKVQLRATWRTEGGKGRLSFRVQDIPKEDTKIFLRELLK